MSFLTFLSLLSDQGIFTQNHLQHFWMFCWLWDYWWVDYGWWQMKLSKVWYFQLLSYSSTIHDEEIRLGASFCDYICLFYYKSNSRTMFENMCSLPIDANSLYFCWWRNKKYFSCVCCKTILLQCSAMEAHIFTMTYRTYIHKKVSKVENAIAVLLKTWLQCSQPCNKEIEHSKKWPLNKVTFLINYPRALYFRP